MLNSSIKLSVVILCGAMTLGFSSVVVAKDNIIITNWISAHKKLDCPTTCRATPLKYPMVSGIIRERGKKPRPISICTTHKDRRGPWFTGYNLWGEKTCTVAIGDEVYRGEIYKCLCTTHPIKPLE